MKTKSGPPTIADLQAENARLRQRVEELETVVGSIDPTSLADLLRDALDALPAHVSFVDRSGRYRYINRTYEEWFGLSRNEIIGRHVRDVVGEKAYRRTKDRARTALSGESTQHKNVLSRADGTQKTVETRFVPHHTPDGSIDGYFVLAIDISERERALRSLELTQFTVDNAADAILWADQRGKLQYVNTVVCETLGYSRDELVKLTLFDIDPDLSPEHWPTIWDRDTRRKQTKFETNHKRKDGSLVPVEVTANFVEHDGRQMVCSFIRDIGARKRAEEEVRAAKHTAENANLAKSRFLATMSHEIRTPLNAVIGMAGLVLDADLPENQREYVATIRDSGEVLLGLINDILDLSKLEAGKIDLEHVPFALDDVVSTVANLLRSTAEAKGINFTATVADGTPRWVEGDYGRARQVLLNLASNAIKFTEKGDVTIFVEPAAVSDTHATLKFTVYDTGIGIKAEDQGKLFVPFSQVDSSDSRQYGGTGLGLSICKSICDLMGGEIGFDSDPSIGTTFWFTLTLKKTSRIPPASSPDPEPARGAAKTRKTALPLRILVAEDNHVNQRVGSAILMQMGHKVDVVSNGLEAVEAIRSLPYDVVLMDIQMPAMGGIEATKAIRALPGDGSEIPIIALTANAMKGDRETYLAAGMNDHVTKPVTADKLADAIEQQMQGKANRAQ